MKYYTTIQELIASVDKMEVSYRNLHTQVYINTKGENLKIPYKSLLRDYRPFLSQSIITIFPSEIDKILYRYKPKKLSLDLYDTTELWSDILELNHLISTIEFTLEKESFKIFDPRSFFKLLNEVLILEGILK